MAHQTPRYEERIMKRTRWSWLLACGALCAVVGWAGRADAVLCFQDMKEDGTGKPLKWPTMPVKYYINASAVDPAKKAAWIKAVQDAFATYQAVPCTTLAFKYEGEHASVAYVQGAILVVFSGVVTGGSYYWGNTQGTQFEPADITQALIQMNIKEAKGSYGIGAAPNQIDIQTAVTQMIPWAVGFYAGSGDPNKGNLPAINYNVVTTTLTAEQIQGVQAQYPKTGAGCSSQPLAQPCKTVPPPPGGEPGKPKEAGPVTPGKEAGPVGPGKETGPVTPGKDAGPTKYNEAGQPIPPAGDGPGLPGKEEDKGCCRVSHATSHTGNLFLALVGGLILLGLLRRRRR
jgi:hypothetical protein